MAESENIVDTIPSESAKTLPRSPTWRTWSCGPPCFNLSGLKWPPVLRQPPSDRSPLLILNTWNQNYILNHRPMSREQQIIENSATYFAWTWNPWLPGCRPSIMTSTVTMGSVQEDCMKVTSMQNWKRFYSIHKKQY